MSAISRQSHGHPVALLATLAVLGAMSACTSQDTPPPIRTVLETAWTAPGIDPVSAVGNVGGVAVVYGTTADGLLIYGLDAVTGAQLWSKPAVLAAEADHVEVAQAHDKVTYFRPTGTDRVSELVIADPTTGADLAVSAARYWSWYGTECAGTPAAVCLESKVQLASGDWQSRTFRVDEATGQTQPEVSLDLDAPSSYPSSGDLRYLPGADDEPATVARRVNGTDLWSTPFAELFGPTVTSPGGLAQHDSKDGTYSVVTAGTDWWNGTGRVDLASDRVTAGISLTDGSSKWIAAGTVVGCLGNHRMLGWDATDAAAGSAFRCRYTGSATGAFNPPTDAQYVTSNLDVTVERFDPATGDVTWAAAVGAARTLAADLTTGQSDAVVDDDHLYIPNSTGGVVLDLTTGETRPPGAADTMWCNDSRPYDRVEPDIPDVTVQVTTARRDGVYRTCRSDGSDGPVPTTSMPAEVSIAFGNEVRVVPLNGAVTGFLAPPINDPSSDAQPDQQTQQNPEQSAEQPPGPGSATQNPIAAAQQPSGPMVTAPTQEWSSTGFEPLTTPELIGGTAVLYGTVGQDLYLFGLDPKSGTERWRQWASAAGLAPTTTIRVVEIDGTIAYLRPTERLDNNSVLVLADPATGADRLLTQERWWSGFPAICADDPAFLCGSSFEKSGAEYLSKAVRINRTNGSAQPADTGPATAETPYRTLWGDLVEVKGAAVETVGVLRDNALLWSAPVTDLLGSGASLDNGWIISGRPGVPRLLYLTVPVNWNSDGTTGYPALDLAANLMTVGLNYQDGSVIWREPGTSTVCRGRLGDMHLMSTPGSGYPALRCRYSGRLDSSPPGGWNELTVPTDLSVTLERVDLTTGKALWSIPLGAQASLAIDGPQPANILLDDHRMLFGEEVVDVATGTVRSPTGDDVFWCPGRRTFAQTVVFTDRTGERTDRSVGGQVFPCDASGNPATGVPAAVPLAVSRATDDGLRLVSTPSGVIAYRVPA